MLAALLGELHLLGGKVTLILTLTLTLTPTPTLTLTPTLTKAHTAADAVGGTVGYCGQQVWVGR